MADILTASKPQSTNEIRQWDFDFGPDLPAGITVATATAVHVPPSGSASSPTVGTIVANVVPVRIGPLSAIGLHRLTVLATHSDGTKSEMQLGLEVAAL